MADVILGKDGYNTDSIEEVLRVNFVMSYSFVKMIAQCVSSND